VVEARDDLGAPRPAFLVAQHELEADSTNGATFGSVRRVLVLGLVAASVLAACGSDDGGGESGSVAEAVEEQLGYLDPESALVVALDLRYEEENWESLRGIADRVLEETRGVVEPESRRDVPEDAEAAVAEFTRFSNLNFEDDVRPHLTGHLVIGIVLEPDPGDPEENTTLVYRADQGNLREVAEKALDNSRLRPVPGRDDVVVSEDGVAVVGDDTLVGSESREDAIAAIERAEAGRGFAPELLDAAEQGAGIPDPLLLATATPDIGRAFFDGEDVERARAEVPYLSAVERIDFALDVSEDAVTARGQVATTAAQLTEEQLPLGPAGQLELPTVQDAIAGGSLDQSRITTFAASVARSLFADSEFVAAVEETERELGIRFEDEVLRQFDCPSVSVFEPEGADALGTAGRFSARSCVRDPERMRELLPELAPRLPRILHALRGLSGEGLMGLLMLAPDAPLSPGMMLLQVGVQPLERGGLEEQLYEVSGLRESETGEEVFAGPDRVVFGMIGDDFVVGSDRQAARDAATLETEPASEQAASALRVPPGPLGELLGSDEAGEVLARTFGDLEIGFSADARATRAHARMPLAD
jgi:hypothetical protein